MDVSLENNLEQTMFERGAEKCVTKNDRIAFCRKYLEKHSPEKVKESPYTEIKDSLIANDLSVNLGHDIRSVSTLHVKKSISNISMIVSHHHHIQRELVDQLMEELKKNYMVFEKFKNYAMDSTEFHAAIKVAKWNK